MKWCTSENPGFFQNCLWKRDVLALLVLRTLHPMMWLNMSESSKKSLNLKPWYIHSIKLDWSFSCWLYMLYINYVCMFLMSTSCGLIIYLTRRKCIWTNVNRATAILEIIGWINTWQWCTAAQEMTSARSGIPTRGKLRGKLLWNFVLCTNNLHSANFDFPMHSSGYSCMNSLHNSHAQMPFLTFLFYTINISRFDTIRIS